MGLALGHIGGRRRTKPHRQLAFKRQRWYAPGPTSLSITGTATGLGTGAISALVLQYIVAGTATGLGLGSWSTGYLEPTTFTFLAPEINPATLTFKAN